MAPLNLSPTGPQGYPGGYVPNPLISQTYLFDKNLSEAAQNEIEYEIVENKKYYKVELVAPGFKRENFLVSINEKCFLSVTAMHSEEYMKDTSRYYPEHLEHACLHRKISLPKNIDTDFVNAEYKSGILSILFSKTEKQYKRRASMIIVY